VPSTGRPPAATFSDVRVLAHMWRLRSLLLRAVTGFRTAVQPTFGARVVVRLDADERLVVDASEAGATWLRGAIERTRDEAVAMICIRREHRLGFVRWFPRCYRRSQWEWHFPVHEQLRPRHERRLPVMADRGAMVSHFPEGRHRRYRWILE
jgi:hypothetical protein